MERAWVWLLLGWSACAWPGGEPVEFPGAGLTLTGRLYRPEGPGPFPAFVLMHGCSGLWRRDGQEPAPALEAWADHWRKRGYLALHVDSFGPRGEREICTHRTRTIRPERDRPLDAHAALRWLAQRPDVDPKRIHLQGWSNGGMAVLGTVREGAPGYVLGGAEFRSAVAFYPGCTYWTRMVEYRSRVPLLIQAGAEDDWTPSVHCEALVLKSAGRGARMEIDVYPESHHAFDGVGAVRARPEVSNPASPTGWGATVGANPRTRAQAYQRTTEWVAAHDR